MLIPPLMGILSNANIAIVAGLGGWMALQGLATVGTIAAFYQLLAPLRRAAAPVGQPLQPDPVGALRRGARLRGAWTSSPN